MLAELKNDLRESINHEKAAVLPRFFKTGPGEYGEGDKFLGVIVPTQRAIAIKYKDLPLLDVKTLIQSTWHEERLTGLFILIHHFLKADESGKREIYDFYIHHTAYINNWDLVDSSAGYIVGGYLANKPEKMTVLRKLAYSGLLWDRRIAMIATLAYIVKGQPDEALEIAEILLHDKHDLIQKAVGWMLREVGKRCEKQLLIDFLAKHYKTMPRTTLRYAIEHFDAPTRLKYLKGEA